MNAKLILSSPSSFLQLFSISPTDIVLGPKKKYEARTKKLNYSTIIMSSMARKKRVPRFVRNCLPNFSDVRSEFHTTNYYHNRNFCYLGHSKIHMVLYTALCDINFVNSRYRNILTYLLI